MGIGVHEKDDVSAYHAFKYQTERLETRRCRHCGSVVPESTNLPIMAVSKAVAFAFLSLISQVVRGQNATDNLKHVDQLIGSANGGQ